MTGPKKNIYGGLFDFDHDGETSLEEEIIGFNIFKESSSDHTDYDDYDRDEYSDDYDC